MKNKILIINTGGTFNKVYNPLNGTLEINSNNNILDTIFKNAYKDNNNIKIVGMIYKDSLDITNNDRKKLSHYIKKSKYKKVLIIHGTDTMNKTAAYLSKDIQSKEIILTGAMKPFSIEPIEATSNLMMAMGFLNKKVQNKVYICMNGLVKEHIKIVKNYDKGVFECQI